MRLLPILLLSSFCAFSFGDEIHLSPRFQTVYITEMANSFDQHLASRLTAGRVLWVVLDPGNADAVITDSLDENFVAWMQRTFQPGPGAPANDLSGATLRRTAGYGERPRGTVFLVDPRKRIVLWSACELRRDSSSAEADKAAIRLANGLKAAFGKK